MKEFVIILVRLNFSSRTHSNVHPQIYVIRLSVYYNAFISCFCCSYCSLHAQKQYQKITLKHMFRKKDCKKKNKNINYTDRRTVGLSNQTIGPEGL